MTYDPQYESTARRTPLYHPKLTPPQFLPPLLHLIQAKREREGEKKSEIHVIHFASLSFKAGRASRVLGVKNSIS